MPQIALNPRAKSALMGGLAPTNSVIRWQQGEGELLLGTSAMPKALARRKQKRRKMERVLVEAGRGTLTEEENSAAGKRSAAQTASPVLRDGFAGPCDDSARTSQRRLCCHCQQWVTLRARLPSKTHRFLASIVYQWKGFILMFFKYALIQYER